MVAALAHGFFSGLTQGFSALTNTAALHLSLHVATPFSGPREDVQNKIQR